MAWNATDRSPSATTVWPSREPGALEEGGVSLTEAARRTIARRLADLLAGPATPVSVGSALRLNELFRRLGIYVPSIVRQVARAQLNAGEIRAARDTATYGMERDPTDAGLAHLLSMALEGLGHHASATAVPVSSSLDHDPAWWGRWSSNAFMSTGRQPEPPADVSSSDDLNEAVANRAWIEAILGDVEAVARTVGEVLDDPRSSVQAVLWAAVAGSVPAALVGRPDVAERLVNHAASIAADYPDRLTPFAQLQVDSVRTMVAVRSGTADPGDGAASDPFDGERSDFDRAVRRCVAGFAARESGRFREGIEHFDAGLAAFEGDPFGFITWAQSERNVCVAMVGAEEPRALFDRDMAPGLYRSCLARNAAWVAAADGSVDDAIALTDEAAAIADERHQHVHVVLALVDLARFGEPRRAVARFRLLPELPSRLWRIADMTITALVDDELELLLRAAQACRAIHLEPLSTELARRAISAAIRAGRHATAAQIDLHRMLDDCRTPIARESRSDPAAITPREREIALLAGAGSSSAVIAERLGISQRTVDNLLGKVYVKCGFGNGRPDLVRLHREWS